MTPREADVLANVRAAYGRGRILYALRLAALVAPMVIASFAGCGRPGTVLAIGATLAALVAVMAWRGGVASRAVVPGLVAGAAALVLALVVCLAVERAGIRGELALAACGAAGLVAGLMIAAIARRSGQLIAVAGTIAALAGALGCVSAGFGGVVAMAAGFVVAAPLGLGVFGRPA